MTGLVAFFGAPLAVEQAPQRAVRAALAMHDAVARMSARVERERGIRVQLRVGINTGPVIVGTVGKKLRMDYKAIGHTVILAARMEQTAAPGTVQLAEHTYNTGSNRERSIASCLASCDRMHEGRKAGPPVQRRVGGGVQAGAQDLCPCGAGLDRARRQAGFASAPAPGQGLAGWTIGGQSPGTPVAGQRPAGAVGPAP